MLFVERFQKMPLRGTSELNVKLNGYVSEVLAAKVRMASTVNCAVLAAISKKPTGSTPLTTAERTLKSATTFVLGRSRKRIWDAPSLFFHRLFSEGASLMPSNTRPETALGSFTMFSDTVSPPTSPICIATS